MVLFVVSAMLSTPATTAQVVGGSIGAIVAGEQASALPGVSLTLSAPAPTKIERGNLPRGSAFP